MTRLSSALVVALLLSAPSALFAQARIVFVAGPKDHGGPGAHEYEKDLAALKACLDSSNVTNVRTELHTGQLPDARLLDGAAVLVMESSGDRFEQEQHALFPFDGRTDHRAYDAATMARLDGIDELARKGMGVVVLHYTTYVNNATARRHFQEWVGGYYESGYSRTVTTEWKMEPQAVSHPILRGVTPWTYREELYISLRVPETDPRRVPLLVATPTAPTRLPALTAPMVPGGPPSTSTSANVEPSLVSWAVEREGRGRGFVMTGVHSHRHLAIEPAGRQLLNGIVWAANLEVPAGGVQCSMPIAPGSASPR